ncbi:MAG: hypothetical protein HY303_16680 [Candidatus Wallbacteria bacterium]|nr:hypothetical protein [Candidatus Wallbacteria bacterium]
MRRAIGWVAALALATAVASVHAGGTRQRVVRTAEDFGQGEVEGLSIRENGVLAQGRMRQVLPGFGRSVWSAVTVTGGAIYVATGEPAGLYKLEAGKAVQIHADARAMGYTLAAAPDGSVYAGELSQGAVLKVASNGRIAPYSSFPAGSIWAMVCDAAGNLYVGTGPRGVLYRITPAGQVESWLDTDEHNLLCVAMSGAGKVLAGGGERGNVYSIGEKNRAEIVCHFSTGSEVRALVPVGDLFYAAVNSPETEKPAERRRDRRDVHEQASESAPPPPDNGPRQDDPPDGDDVHASRVQHTESPEPVTPMAPEFDEGQPLLSGSLYSVDAAQKAELIASFPDEVILSLAREDDGGLLVGTGPHGRLYRVDPVSGDRTILHQLEQAHVTCLAAKDGRLAVAGTAESGAVVLSGAPSPIGTWTSPVYDAGAVSRFGQLSIFGTGAVQVFTRSGNDPTPERRWSDWSAPLVPPGGPTASPAGRYLQLRVQLDSAAREARVEELNFYHAGPNHRPRIESLTVTSESAEAEPQAKALQSKTGNSSEKDLVLELPPPADGASPHKGKAKKRDKEDSTHPPAQESKKQLPVGLRRIAWAATDSDDDQLSYRLQFRDTALGERALWLPLGKDFPLEDTTEYSWDTTLVPDGRYEIRLLATDERSNAASSVLTAEKVSEPVVVDNTRPEVADLVVSGDRVTGVARDRGSHIAALAVSVDGGPFSPVEPADGIFDGPEEKFSFRVPPCDPGPHVLAVEATDAEGNTGMAHVLIRADAGK